ncbi:DUF6443 domain-containing protein [Sphingobacterium siyangense]|uniref:DUF6443 domain-containing protein n=1 Tax=Sphingobacterium siyangense TaxID=459529 RepID=UPI002FD977A1
MSKYIHYINYIISTGLLASSAFSVSAQTGNSNIPVTPAVAPALSSYTNVVNFSNAIKKNYVRVQIPDEPTTYINSSVKHRQSTQYIDGLGRPLQTVNFKAHADGYDIIQHHVYDAMGRESVQLLPFTAQETSSDGNLQYNAKMRIEQFYPPSDGQQPYGVTEFDNSPLSRPIKQMAPGKNWVGNSRGKTMIYDVNGEKYLLNGASPTYYVVKGCYPRFSVGSTNSLQYNGHYEDGQLYITRVTDEDGQQSEEVTDKLGRIVARRQLSQISTAPMYTVAPKEMFPINYTYTFYVYDDLGRLRYVLPPGATIPQVDVSSNTVNNITTTTYYYTWSLPNLENPDGLYYSYRYDGRGRLVERKIPGKAVEYMVYDSRDRMVLSQDGNLRAQDKWMMTVYDAMNRPVLGALVNSTNSRSAMVGVMDNAGSYAVPGWRYYATQTDLFHNYPANITDAYILSYTYYDDYAELTGVSFNSSKIPAAPVGDASVVNYSNTFATKGMVTGSKMRVLDPDNPNTNQWLTSAQFYDDKGRPIQNVQGNHKGGTDITGSLYYFQGMPYRNITWHQNPSAQVVPGATTALTNIKLDKTYKRNLSLQGGNDLVWSLTQSINDGTPYELAYYDYNHLNQPVIKQFTSTDILHEYNIRGWLNHIQARKSTNHDVNFFNETLHYDDGFANKLYNGNIAGITWKYYDSLGSGANNAYGYTYDKLSRLSHAEYRELSQGGLWLNSHKDYTASSITYDDRGNILTMNQRGNITNPINMDQLQYTYAANSNKLVKVKDNVTAASTGTLPDFKDGADLGIEYTYDANGNLILDENKQMTVEYTYLNKPSKIDVSGKGTISYVYDAVGNRLKKTVHDNVANTTEVWDYIGNFVYKDNVLQYILNEEGRSRPEVVTTGAQSGQTKFVYDYFIKDHLGNVRSTVTAQPINQQYLALHEIATANSEQLIFDNIALVRDDKPGSISPGDLKAAHLVANDPHMRIGTAIMLRVMPGDKFTFAADSYYESDQTETTETPHAEEVVNSLLSALTGGTVGGIPVEEAGESKSMINQALGNQEVVNFIEQQMYLQQQNNGPKAGLNYLFFDENFNLIPTISGKIGIPLFPGTFSNMSVNPTPMTQPGYVVVFVDNNSIGTDVWFDNVQISHFKGQVLEENHYYPFGLTISQSSIGVEQPYKLTSKELEKAFDLNTYDFGARQYDMQIGRWTSIDPLAEMFSNASPFNYCNNNPIRNIDLDGKKWKEAGDREYATDLINGLNSRISETTEELSKLNIQKSNLESKVALGGKNAEKIQRKLDGKNAEINAQTEMLTDLKKSKSELIEMGNDPDQVFSFKSYEGREVGYTDRKEDGSIEIGHVNKANAIHEAAHGYDKWKGETGTQVTREITPYQRQFSYDPSTIINGATPSDWGNISNRSQITPEWILFIHTNGFVYPYYRISNPSPAQISKSLKYLKNP